MNDSPKTEDLGVEAPAKRPDTSELKKIVNNLLWEWMPDSTTLGEADKLACSIFGEISDAWDEHDAQV